MELKITKKYELDLSGRSYHFVIIGCGGNGSFLIRDLARLIAIKNQDIVTEYERRMREGERNLGPAPAIHHMTICDGDTIEAKNIRRQNFVPADIDENKASVLAQRYSQAYGMEINCCDQYLNSAEHLSQLCFVPSVNYRSTPIVIGCVDNNATRSIIAQFIDTEKLRNAEAFWLDGGNEEFSGQVILGSTYSRSPQNYRDTDRLMKFATPFVTQIYPEILDVTDKRPDQMSCDDRAVSFPQCIATNITVATLMLNFCNFFINMPSKGLTSHMVTFDTERINFGTTFNTDESLAKAARTNPIWKRPELKIGAKEVSPAPPEAARAPALAEMPF